MHLGTQVADLPGLRLGIERFETGEKFSVSEFPQAGEVICHMVEFARDVGDFMVVSVVPLVKAGEAAKVGGCGVGCDGALSEAGHGGRVVTQGGDSSLAGIEDLGGDVSLG